MGGTEALTTVAREGEVRVLSYLPHGYVQPEEDKISQAKGEIQLPHLALSFSAIITDLEATFPGPNLRPQLHAETSPNLCSASSASRRSQCMFQRHIPATSACYKRRRDLFSGTSSLLFQKEHAETQKLARRFCIASKETESPAATAKNGP